MNKKRIEIKITAVGILAILLVVALYGAGIFDSEELPLEVVVSTPTPTATAVATATPTAKCIKGREVYKVGNGTWDSLERAMEVHERTGEAVFEIGYNPQTGVEGCLLGIEVPERILPTSTSEPPTEMPSEVVEPTLISSSVPTHQKGT